VGAGAVTTLQIRTVTGALVRTLARSPVAPGRFTATWDGRDDAGQPAASGVYYCELAIGSVSFRHRLTLVR